MRASAIASVRPFGPTSAPFFASIARLRPAPAVDPSPASLVITQDHPERSVDADALESLIRHVVDAEGARLASLSVVLSDHATVRRLNREYLDHDYDTDVLSFSLRGGPDASADEASDGSVVDGEVYVDLDTAAERCAEFDATFEAEAQRYAVHGVLHLLGYDDATPEGQSTMRALEDRYLQASPHAQSDA